MFGRTNGYQQPQQQYGGGRSLHLEQESYGSDHIIVFDSEASRPVYRTSSHMTRPYLRITSPAAGNRQISGIVMHSHTTRVDVELHSQSLTLTKTGVVHIEHHFHSLALGGKELKWVHSGITSREYKLLDTAGATLALLTSASSWTRKKLGKLDLLVPMATSGYLMDEIVCTALIFMQEKLATRSVTATA